MLFARAAVSLILGGGTAAIIIAYLVGFDISGVVAALPDPATAALLAGGVGLVVGAGGKRSSDIGD